MLLDMARSLCEELVARPAFQQHREAITGFMEDAGAVALLERAREVIGERQEFGEEASCSAEEEREAVERLMANEKAARFLAAQEDLKNTEALLHLMVTRTLELGRVPGPDELLPDDEEGCCGGECECEDEGGCADGRCGCG